MKLIDLINARKQLSPILALNFPYKIRRQLKELVRAIEKEYEDYADEEMELIRKYAKTEADGRPILINGNILTFETAEKKKAYDKEIAEINNTEIQWTLPVMEITEKDIDGQKISVDTEMELEPFILFKE